MAWDDKSRRMPTSGPALVHLRDVDLLRSVWLRLPPREREAALARRPLLQRLEGVAADTKLMARCGWSVWSGSA